MAARLLFAVLTGGSHECLAMDEGFGAGDTSFYEQAQERMTRFLGSAGTLRWPHIRTNYFVVFVDVAWYSTAALGLSGPLENALDYYHRNHFQGRLASWLHD